MQLLDAILCSAGNPCINGSCCNKVRCLVTLKLSALLLNWYDCGKDYTAFIPVITEKVFACLYVLPKLLVDEIAREETTSAV